VPTAMLPPNKRFKQTPGVYQCGDFAYIQMLSSLIWRRCSIAPIGGLKLKIGIIELR
jgi:hypothetical protein